MGENLTTRDSSLTLVTGSTLATCVSISHVGTGLGAVGQREASPVKT
jgi:hypothetical protein